MLELFLYIVCNQATSFQDIDLFTSEFKDQDSIKFFRNKFESPELKSSRDYEFVVVDKEIFVTPLNESAWEKLKPWKLSNKELISLWNNRKTA